MAALDEKQLTGERSGRGPEQVATDRYLQRRLAGDQIVYRLRADTRSDAVSLIGFTQGGNQLLVSELLESLFRFPDRDDPPPILDWAGDVELAALWECAALHDLR